MKMLNQNKAHPWVRDVIAWHCVFHPRCTAITTDPYDPEAMRYSISVPRQSCREIPAESTAVGKTVLSGESK